MHIISYLAQDTTHLTAVQERLALAKPPMILVVAHSLPALISQAQSLPLRAVLVDMDWPREAWESLIDTVKHTNPDLPVLALAPSDTETEWWQYACDFARLDERPDLFLFRVRRAVERLSPIEFCAPLNTQNATIAPVLLNESPNLLEHAQFRKFAEIFSASDEFSLADAFVAWVQQACQTSRAVLLLQDPQTGAYRYTAHRGLPSLLTPHCQFAQTAPICRWMASSGRILFKDVAEQPDEEVQGGLDLMQAAAAIPMLLDGQLFGILGIGPRLVGQAYTAIELEGLFALAGQIAVAIQRSRLHDSLQRQQEMTEHMLTVMPSGTLVLDAEQRVAFVNPAAATLIGATPTALTGQDLRALPSPLGDLAYEVLIEHEDRPRQEVEIGPERRPLGVSALALSTTPLSAMLLLEDLSPRRLLGEERERRANLEVITNLVHFLVHELRNPLVALSTFSSLVPERAGDPDFQEFCATVLQGEIGRVNLLLEQLLVLTNHAEFHFGPVELLPILERLTISEELRTRVVASLPLSLPAFHGDEQQLETALGCILRSVTRLSREETPTTLNVEYSDDWLVIHTEVPAQSDLLPETLLNPWEQFLVQDEQYVDLGLATAQYIVEQHTGSLRVTFTDQILTVICRIPMRIDAAKEQTHDLESRSSRRR